MLLLRTRDPVVRLDAAWQSIQLLCDAGNIAGLPPRDLDISEGAHLIERPLDRGADALDLLQIILAGSTRRFRRGHLEAQLVGGAIGPGEHRAAVIPHTKRGAHFPEPLTQSGYFLFLIAHD